MLVAIETTGDTCGVALFHEGKLLVELHSEIARSHDRLLAQLYTQGLEAAGVGVDTIEAIAVSVGPGSYTGIRIGLAFVIGLAMAGNLPIIPVPTLDAIAYAVRDLGKVGHRSRVMSLIPAGRFGVYAGLYTIQPDFTRLTDVRTLPIERVPPLLDENIFAAGPGARLLNADCAESVAIDSEVLTARAIGMYGLHLKEAGLTCTPEEVEPLYISGITSVGASA